jgi:hypothetical protein
MNHKALQLYRATEKQLTRMAYERDPHLRCARHVVEAGLQAGDDLMAFWQYPTDDLKSELARIGRTAK